MFTLHKLLKARNFSNIFQLQKSHTISEILKTLVQYL